MRWWGGSARRARERSVQQRQGLDTGSQGNVYVADGTSIGVQVFSAKGTFKAKYVAESGSVSDVADGPTGDV